MDDVRTFMRKFINIVKMVNYGRHQKGWREESIHSLSHDSAMHNQIVGVDLCVQNRSIPIRFDSIRSEPFRIKQTTSNRKIWLCTQFPQSHCLERLECVCVYVCMCKHLLAHIHNPKQGHENESSISKTEENNKSLSMTVFISRTKY